MTATGACGYVFDHMWAEERTRLGGLEAALDPGTRDLLDRLGAGPGRRCLEVGAGGGTVARWLADRVVPGGSVVATDIETGFLDAQAQRHPALEVLRHDLLADDLPGGFDLVHARWLLHWLPGRALGLRRMVGALRPEGVLLVEEPDFVTAFGACEPPVLRRVLIAGIRLIEEVASADAEYGRRLLDDLTAAGLVEVAAEGRCPLVRGGSSPAAHFLRLTLEKVRQPLVTGGKVTGAEMGEAVAALDDPSVTVVMPMTVAAWGRRPG
jgi:SAM-dependent methyltransferase